MNADQLLSQAANAARRGALADGESLCRSLLQNSPRHFLGWLVLADILVLANRPGEALAAYETAAGINPGHSVPFSRAAIVRFRTAYGQSPKPRISNREDRRARIQMTRLGAYGRFGNQLLQYAFVRLYAEEHDLIAELPDWIGRDLYDHDDPFPSAALPLINEKDFGGAAVFGAASRTLSGHDVTGFFCGDISDWGDRAAQFRALFVPGRKIRGALDQAGRTLASAGTTVVALHLRRADFGYGRFWVAPVGWYLDWLRTIWAGLDRPVLYIATDDRDVVARFAEFSPWDSNRIGVNIAGADFLVDHHMLRQASHLAISNSSFSFTAAMLNERALTFMRPHPNRRELVAFDPWSANVLLDPVVEHDQVAAAQRGILETRFQARDVVVHIGRHCSPWTNLARSLHPEMRIHELDEGESIDEFRSRHNGAPIKHLVVEDVNALRRTLASASDSLARASVHMVHFCVSPKGAIAAMPDELVRNFYRVFASQEGSLLPVDASASLAPGCYVAVNERSV